MLPIAAVVQMRDMIPKFHPQSVQIMVSVTKLKMYKEPTSIRAVQSYAAGQRSVLRAKHLLFDGPHAFRASIELPNR